MEDGTAHTQHCVLCNYQILPSRHDRASIPSFLSQFRTVFTTSDSQWTKAHLSDVTRDSSWDNGIPGYNNMSNRRTTYWRQPTNPTSEWKVARNYSWFQECVQGRQPQNIVWLFPFHADCWKMLEEAADRLEISLDIQAIYDVALTFHLEDTLRNNYIMEHHHAAGLMSYSYNLAKYDILGTWDTFTPCRHRDWERDQNKPHVQKRTKTGVERIQRFAEAVGNGVTLERTQKLAKYRVDPFSKLPPELHQAIFVELPFASLLSLRIASRSCAAVTISSAFFHSRLDPRGPLGHVLSFADVNKDEEGHWRYAFDRALKLASLSGLRHRKIAWIGAVDLLDLVRLRLEAPLCQGSEGRHWKRGRLGSLYTPPRRYWGGIVPGEDPGSQNSRWVEICKLLERVEVSTMRLHHRQFVTGLSFQYEDGTTAGIGYMHPKSTVTVWSFQKAQTRNINRISVATDNMGVRGIRVHHNGPDIWAGDSDGVGVEKRALRLRGYTPLGHPRYRGRFIEGAFDVSVEAKHQRKKLIKFENLKLCDIA